MDTVMAGIQWSLMLPEIVLAGLAVIILLIDVFTGIRGSKPYLGIFSLIALAASLILLHMDDSIGNIDSAFMLDPFSILFKTIILIGTALVILLSMHYLRQHPQVYQGEFYYLMLFAAAGAMVMVSSADLITLYIGLEILSIASYCLAGFRKSHVKSSEAAMKYVILGGVSSAFILYGMSFVYGLTGSTSLPVIGYQMTDMYLNFSALTLMSLLFMVVGFGFKISSVPFHMWAPDVYEGAPTPVTAFIAVISKVAAFAMMLRLLSFGYSGVFGQWYVYIAILAAMTMIVGNIAALTQNNVKRLMAYSGIAQAGYLLVPVAAAITWDFAFSQIFFYACAYLLMNLGVFAVITVVTEDAKSEAIASFAGLHQRSPFLAFSMSVFLLSLAGLPVTAGFFGKFYIFLGVMTRGMYWLAAVMALTSICSFYYYFSIIKQMYMQPTYRETLKAPASLSVVVWFCLLGTLVLGVMPNLLTNFLNGVGWFM